MSTPGHKLSRLIRPTLDTPFHIDFDWWGKDGRDLRAYLLSQIPPDMRDAYAELNGEALVDVVNAESGEVKQEDGLLSRVRSLARQQSDFVTAHTSIVDAIFRTFLINDNQPLTAYELSRRINRDAGLILRTLAGGQVYKGLRPYIEKG
ncbi:MAG TPA: hypothetical protein VIK33_08360 [Anaerolineae bacterium]